MSYKSIGVIGLIITVLFTGCSQITHISGTNSESTNFENATTNHAVEAERVTVQEVEAFLKENTVAMEALSMEMLRSYEKGEELQYYPKEDCLYRYGEDSYIPQEKLESHPVKEKASFLQNTCLFDLIAIVNDHRILEPLHCDYCVFIYDEQEELDSCIRLIYCDSPVVEKEYFRLTEILPHWYYLVEYFE